MKIAELQTGEEIIAFYLLLAFQKKTASNGNPYYQLTLADRSGTIEARLFAVSDMFGSPEEYAAGTIVKVKGMVETFNKKLNMKLSRVRIASEVETEEHLPRLIRRSVRPPADILRDVKSMIEDLNEFFPLEAKLCSIVLESIPDATIERAGAAGKLHHAYVGGYLEHVLSLMEASLTIAPHYGLDAGTMTALAFFHDIGKLMELVEVNGVFEYTREGILFGHIAMGYSLVQQWADVAIKSIDGMLSETAKYRVEAILHGILSHHGELAYGSPVLPATREAIAFHHLDNLDSKLQMEAEAWESVPEDALIHPERHYKLGTKLVRYPHSLRLRSFEDERREDDTVNDGAQ